MCFLKSQVRNVSSDINKFFWFDSFTSFTKINDIICGFNNINNSYNSVYNNNNDIKAPDLSWWWVLYHNKIKTSRIEIYHKLEQVISWLSMENQNCTNIYLAWPRSSVKVNLFLWQFQFWPETIYTQNIYRTYGLLVDIEILWLYSCSIKVHFTQHAIILWGSTSMESLLLKMLIMEEIPFNGEQLQL